MPPARPSRLRLLASSWIVRSLAVGAVAASIDYTIVWTTAVPLGFPAAVAALCGLSVGTTVNFLLNRRVAFRDCGDWAGAALRYAVSFGALMILHAITVGFLRDRLGLPILASKLAADLGLLAGGQLLLLRYIVFPRNKRPGPAVAARAEPESA